MNNEIQVFTNEDFGKIRIIEVEGKPLFCGSDIAKALGYAIPSKAVNTHCKGVSKMEVPTNGGTQTMLFITEGDMYRLIAHSQLPAAEKFESWVFDEVLPSIRKHGMYATDELLDNPDLLIAAATKLKEERSARIEAENKVKVLKPKADFYDEVAGSKDSIEMGHVAKVLGIKGIGRNKLFEILRNKKILDKNNIPYQKFVDSGYFRVLEQKYTTPNGEVKINIKTMVFQKGVDYIRKVIKEGD